MPPATTGPTQGQYFVRVREDGTTDIFERWLVTDIPAGSVKSGFTATGLPDFGSFHADWPTARVVARQLLEVIDGTKMLYGIWYSSASSGFFIGAVRRDSETLNSIPHPLFVPRFRVVRFGAQEDWYSIEDFQHPRPRRYRIETRYMNGGESRRNTVLRAIDANVGRYWYPYGANNPGFIFVDGGTVTRGYEQFRVTYKFVMYGKVREFPASPNPGAIGSDLRAPALDVNEEYDIVFGPLAPVIGFAPIGNPSDTVSLPDL